MTFPSEHILTIFLKYPEPGRVKTRLAASVGVDQAASLYRQMVEQVATQTKSQTYQQVFVIDPPHRKPDFQAWLGSENRFEPQIPGTPDQKLGQKLAHAFSVHFKQGAKSVIAIGSDCVDLDHNDIETAFQQLSKTDAVLGPTLDGGYYLIGFHQNVYHTLNQDLMSLFDDIAWSTPQVYLQTCTRLEQHQINASILPMKQDIDTVEDLATWKPFKSEQLI
ncbi:MAG: TIGR04282 family arsenosugar biosynthesis glycosyltransferase [Vampirovibrio sp.]|nr:TIGR04282 family arsenosugar biosynthesis glycosyltransferase [Vampirovibrio sp.]